MRKSVMGALVMLALAMSAGIALAAPQQGGPQQGGMTEPMGGQMGSGQMGGRMGGQRHGRRHQMNLDERVARMKADLNLTDKQADQVRDMFEKHRQAMQSWRGDHPQATRAERREHGRQMMSEMNEGMKKILTAQQFKKWETMRRKRRQRMKKGMSRMPEAPPQN